jgi:hypothetical protein
MKRLLASLGSTKQTPEARTISNPEGLKKQSSKSRFLQQPLHLKAQNPFSKNAASHLKRLTSNSWLKPLNSLEFYLFKVYLFNQPHSELFQNTHLGPPNAQPATCESHRFPLLV